jgi:hypothetical protein
MLFWALSFAEYPKHNTPLYLIKEAEKGGLPDLGHLGHIARPCLKKQTSKQANK